MIELKNKIFFMRHGQSENNILGIESCLFETQSKFGLTEQGRQQVTQSALQFASFDHIFTSPYRRTVETAEIMAQASQCSVELLDSIQEFRLPSRFDQQPYAVAEEMIHDPQNDLKNFCIEDSESFNDLFERVKNTLIDINQRHVNKSILIVSHGSPVEASLQVMKGKCTGFGPFENLPKNAQVICLNEIKHV